MEHMKFEWDEEKNLLNQKKHGISFEVAALVFLDEDAVEFYDHTHSTPEEERYVIIGRVGKVLYVVYTERGTNIRLISARKATPQERSDYYGTICY